MSLSRAPTESGLRLLVYGGGCRGRPGALEDRHGKRAGEQQKRVGEAATNAGDTPEAD